VHPASATAAAKAIEAAPMNRFILDKAGPLDVRVRVTVGHIRWALSARGKRFPATLVHGPWLRNRGIDVSTLFDKGARPNEAATAAATKDLIEQDGRSTAFIGTPALERDCRRLADSS
jgi:hypothetical protein